MNMCERGRRISESCDDKITDADGEPTPLYWHLAQCEDCADKRGRYDGTPPASTRTGG